MKLIYIASFNIVIITMILGIYSALFKIRATYLDFDEVFKVNPEEIDMAEYIIYIIQVVFLVFCPIINTALGIILCVFWKDFRDAIYNNLEKNYVERWLK